MVYTAIFILLIPLFLVAHLVSISNDKKNIAAFIESKGGDIISQKQKLFSIGPLDFKYGRLYSIKYFDNNGVKHKAIAKTSFISGVNIYQDQLVKENKLKINTGINISTEIDKLKKKDNRFKWD